jgi:hypothetical protein
MELTAKAEIVTRMVRHSAVHNVRSYDMKSAIALAALMSAALAAPAFAQSKTTVTTTTSPGASSYYIVQDASTKKCTITHERPAGASMTIVGGDGSIYKTETEAQSAMKTTQVCTQ